MKFRNKQTGKIRDFEFVAISKENDELIATTVSLYTHHAPVLICRSIDQLNAEWEDYKPAEPLIKDEKIRKAVRAWADANNINSRHYHENDVKFNSLEHELTWIDTSIQFNEFGALEGLEDGKRYTIAELCGEDEE